MLPLTWVFAEVFLSTTHKTGFLFLSSLSVSRTLSLHPKGDLLNRRLYIVAAMFMDTFTRQSTIAQKHIVLNAPHGLKCLVCLHISGENKSE